MSHLENAACARVLPNFNVWIVWTRCDHSSIYWYINTGYRFSVRFQSHNAFFWPEIPHLNICVQRTWDYIVTDLSPLSSNAYTLREMLLEAHCNLLCLDVPYDYCTGLWPREHISLVPVTEYCASHIRVKPIVLLQSLKTLNLPIWAWRTRWKTRDSKRRYHRLWQPTVCSVLRLRI